VSPNKLCGAVSLLSATGLGALVVYAFAARRPSDEMTLSTVLDAGVIVTVLIATTLLLRVVAPLRRELERNRWEIQRVNKELRDTRQELKDRMPTAKAIAGYALGELLAEDDDGDDNVVNLRG